jgi:Holliday junction resolvase RusA-like endonuclease
MNEGFVTFYQNPEIDILFGNLDQMIPSKKVDFKPIKAIGLDSDGNQQILDNFYVKKPSSQSVLNFEKLVRKQIIDNELNKNKILKPSVAEVIISISLTKKNFFTIDVDNIAKTVLDSLKGYLFEDDSQVSKLICLKEIAPLNIQGFWIAVTELKDNRQGVLKDLYLYSSIDRSK